MTEHTNLQAKIYIRKYFLNKLKLISKNQIKILECYAGKERRIYNELYVNSDTTSLDKKKIKGAMKIDNRKFISSQNLNYNYFDLDAYGSPYELLLNIFFRKQNTNKPFIVILTDGLYRKMNFGCSTNLIQTIINNKAKISIPALNRHQDFIIALTLKTFSEKFKIKIKESKIIKDHKNQMRYLGLFCIPTGDKTP